MDASAELDFLRLARFRRAVRRSLSASERICVAAGLTTAAVWRAVNRSNWLEAVPWLLALALLAALGVALWRWRSLGDVAREVDIRLGTKDRFVAELQTTEATPWADALHREVAAYAANLRVGEQLRLPGPGRRVLWLLLPMAALALLEGVHHARLAGMRVMAVGDACGYVEPFTGEGIAWAIRSAVEAAAFAVEQGSRWTDAAPAAWEARHRRAVRRQQRACRLIRWMLHRPLLAHSGIALGSMLPPMARAMARWTQSHALAGTERFA